MDSTLAVQQYIQQNIRNDCSDIDKILEPLEGPSTTSENNSGLSLLNRHRDQRSDISRLPTTTIKPKPALHRNAELLTMLMLKEERRHLPAPHHILEDLPQAAHSLWFSLSKASAMQRDKPGDLLLGLDTTGTTQSQKRPLLLGTGEVPPQV
ncbi:Hypothetical predicted protein [Pelobates cultripes]|uniref:Uncharacterized protein n=1 Tax=Pelobates cultripes TaxID=61616 RepID=A0AAD1SRR5_PELCU|nr:Hypothetical predicted protein [Pelobates cultripes]